jgi:transcriptional regulator with XRE-family HTH domain
MNEFGEKIENLRKDRDLTVKEVCTRVGIPQSRLNELEWGVRIPTAGQIERLENFFETASGELAELEPDSEKSD